MYFGAILEKRCTFASVIIISLTNRSDLLFRYFRIKKYCITLIHFSY